MPLSRKPGIDGFNGYAEEEEMTVIAASPDHNDSEPPANDTSERISLWSDEDELLSFPPREERGGLRLCLMLVFARSFQTSEITRHRSFVSGMLGVIHVSFTCLYLPLTMHVLVVTFGLIFFWTLWHSMTNCISVAYVAWGVVWAVWELYFYTVSQHQEWSLFKYCEEIETGRLKAEAWERALRGVVRSVVDGTCECDLEGIILRASPQFAELVGMEQFHLVGQSLSSLCLNAECDRVSTFIQQCVRGDQLAAAATIETILCGKPDGECLRLSLFVAQIPIANGALLAGAQLQGRGNETCHDDPSDTDSTTPTCSGGVCVAMSYVGGSFTPDGAYDSLWDSVKPMTGLRKCCPGACRRLTLVVSALANLAMSAF